MEATDWPSLAYQFGVPGILVFSFIYGVFTDRIFFRRDIRSYQERYEDMRDQRDMANVTATAATEIAKQSSQKLTEAIELLRLILARRE